MLDVKASCEKERAGFHHADYLLWFNKLNARFNLPCAVLKKTKYGILDCIYDVFSLIKSDLKLLPQYMYKATLLFHLESHQLLLF